MLARLQRELNRQSLSEEQQIEVSRHEEQLRERLRRLQLICTRIREGIAEIGLDVDAGLPRASFAAAEARLDFERLQTLALQDDHETWADAFDIQAGHWALHLTGTALPTPQLAITLRGDLEGASSSKPLITLVRPAQGFEIVNLDSSGNGKVALPPDESVMLVQGDEVWEVRLTFNNLPDYA